MYGQSLRKKFIIGPAAMRSLLGFLVLVASEGFKAEEGFHRA